MTASRHDKITCIVRELALRKRVYPKWIKEKRMTAEKAELEISIMSEILDDYLNAKDENAN